MKVCLVFSYEINNEVRKRIMAGDHPRVDYLDLPDFLNAEVIDFGLVKRSRFLLVKICLLFSLQFGLAMLAWIRRGEFDVFCTGSENVGLLLSALLKVSRKRPKLVTMNHHLSHKWKARFFRWFRLDVTTDAIICLNEFQTKFARTGLSVDRTKVFHVNFGACVDGCFFSPNNLQNSKHYILSVGREGRDYETLVKALNTLDIPTTIVASGMRSPAEYPGSLPASGNQIAVQSHLSCLDLRELYAGAAFVILRLHDVEYPAGVTTIMEAMAMGKAVIATQSRGIGEFIENGETGLWTNVGDAEDLRRKILYLWSNPAIAHRMGVNARASVSERVNLGRYVQEVASVLLNIRNNRS